jgi:hypothetical protein
MVAKHIAERNKIEGTGTAVQTVEITGQLYTVWLRSRSSSLSSAQLSPFLVLFQLSHISPNGEIQSFKAIISQMAPFFIFSYIYRTKFFCYYI